MSTILPRSKEKLKGVRYTVIAQDATDGTITFDFNTGYPIVANIQILDAGVEVELSDLIVTYPADGQITLTEDSTFAFEADQVVCLTVQRADVL